MVEQDRPGKMFVGGLSPDVDEKTLENAFSKYGRLTEILVIRDKITAKSRGYGFVTFENPLDAEDAAKGMEGTEINGKPIHTEQAVRSIGMDRGMRGRGGGRRGSSRGGYLDRPRHLSGGRRSPPPRRGGFSMRGGRGGPPSSFHGGRSLMGNGRRDYSPPRKGPLIADVPRNSFAGPPRRDFDGPPRRMSRGDRRDDRNGYRDRSYSPRPRDLYPPSPPLRDTGRGLLDGRGPTSRSRDYGSHDFRDQSRDYSFTRDYSPEPARSRDYGMIRDDRGRDSFSRSGGDYIPTRGSDLGGSRDIGRDYPSSRDYGPPTRDYLREREPIPREYSSSMGRGGSGGVRYSGRDEMDSRGPPREYSTRSYEGSGPSRRSVSGPGSRGPPSQSRGPPPRGPPSIGSSRGRGGGGMSDRRMDRPSFSGSSSRRPGPSPSRGPPPMKRSRLDGPPPSRR
ncbi:RNA binding motif protein, X-linked-like-1 isoform X2 [Gigantopelta aegis]|uniref:RNA binding motif protein, X-linked-like-1 isoform X2 n=1 Tax=Gigantopelta aegis TaxID=1735272 RepID=UPI001B888C42|nr:RNA binding motif protein, X-linked-like-1 isoform X2 [Gigantopelta aegis]